MAALTIGTAGTDVGSSLGGTASAPIITLNIPDASAANRGALTAANWTTFNSKQAGHANLSGLSGLTYVSPSFVKMTAAGTFALDTTTIEIDNITSNNNTTIPTTKAVRTYVATLTGSAFVYKGGTDCSTNPNYPTASAAGEYWKVTVGGKIGGASGIVVQAGDAFISNAANAGGTQAAVGSSWDVIQGNTEDATTSLKGIVQLADATEASAKSNSTKAVTPAALSGYARQSVGTVTADSVTNVFTITHNLQTRDVMVQIREAQSPWDQVFVDNAATTINTVVVTFAVAPTTGTNYKVIVTSL